MPDQLPDAGSVESHEDRDTRQAGSSMLNRVWALLPLVVFGVFANVVQVVSSVLDRQYSTLWTSLGVLAAVSAVALGADLWHRRERWLKHRGGSSIGVLIFGCVALSAISVAALVPVLVVLRPSAGSTGVPPTSLEAAGAPSAIDTPAAALPVPPSAATTGPVAQNSTPTPTASRPATTTGRPVALSAVREGSRQVTVTAELHRPPRQGHVYWFVLEVHDVSGTHSEWYPRIELESSATFPMTIPDDADISRPRTGAVYEVTTQVGEYYRSGRPDPKEGSNDFLLTEPCNCAVSDVITMSF